MGRKLTKRRIKHELFHTNYRRLQRSSRPDKQSPLDDIQAHPEQYLNYEYTENKTDVDSLIKRIEKLEQENADMNRVFEEVVNSESGIL